jgi:CheY-like chemotaxis protein
MAFQTMCKFKEAALIGINYADASVMAQDANLFAKRILVVDDDPSVRQSIALMLGIDHHVVVEAQDGTEALRQFTERPFDLVITDFFMPGMQGDELTAVIKDLLPSQPVLMITAFLEKLAQAGQQTDAILAKPVGLADLRRAVAKQIFGTAFAPDFSVPGLLSRALARTKVLDDILQTKPRTMGSSCGGGSGDGVAGGGAVSG